MERDRGAIDQLLATPATWAVVGLSNNRSRTAYSVAAWLHSTLGMSLIAIHPDGQPVLDSPGYRSLGDIPTGTKVAVVDCFVNSHHVGAVVDDAIANRDRLQIEAVWLQLGVIDEAAAQRARDAGLTVVMNTCPKIEYAPA